MITLIPSVRDEVCNQQWELGCPSRLDLKSLGFIINFIIKFKGNGPAFVLNLSGAL